MEGLSSVVSGEEQRHKMKFKFLGPLSGLLGVLCKDGSSIHDSENEPAGERKEMSVPEETCKFVLKDAVRFGFETVELSKCFWLGIDLRWKRHCTLEKGFPSYK
jgi:hypothetical protein